ncbi:helix-turn-helix domain-containing protein [Actinomycetospora lutea]|uniref:helix-turn-helix domain-containing protein n=1 Tax=Actinomycetospora lutea TaxID=663604 RepID=UPI002366581C|nr:helix-turn-helix domain-containing protein [Actinomycetospora lutea]MDD7938465.1 helix-turn-helix domain-containing protein [Actinomycetospora lutea]
MRDHDLVDVATGVLVERYRLDVEQASVMLAAMAAGDGRAVGEYAVTLLEPRDPAVTGTDGDEPASVRRAVEFIDANAHRVVSTGEIARAAHIGPRGLQASFKRHRGQTPFEYLREVRFGGAHRDLVAGDPGRGSTVGEIAARWQFTNAGRFSVEYRQRHGCSPSSTLRRAPQDDGAMPRTATEVRARARLARQQAKLRPRRRPSRPSSGR